MTPRWVAVCRTREEARALVGDHADVAWVGSDGESARDLLGRTVAAVVLDLHQGLDPDALAQVHGAIRGGGGLVLVVPATAPPHPPLAAWPHGPHEVGHRMWDRVVTGLSSISTEAGTIAAAAPVGTEEQARLVDDLVRFVRGSLPEEAATVVAARGRGKSSAIGLALREVPACRVAVTGPRPEAVAEVIRFAGRGAWVAPHQVSADVDVVVVDEAAQLPIPVLQRLVQRAGRARLVFATTVGGYEGTGRGFALRFGAWLRSVRSVRAWTLSAPVRWCADDPVEAAIDRLLCLDARPAPAERVGGATVDSVRAAVVDRDALAADDAALREVFGLLVHAHYRTTPGDLQRILDAPNLGLHVLWHEGHCVAACVVAHEGGLPAEQCARVGRGLRLRGHALPETLMCHAGVADAGTLTMVRSVRLAVHPAARRRGLAGRLVEHVHDTYRPDLFGTLFGAVPEVIAMRRSLGYALVRVGASRGSRTGEPTAVMVRATSPRATELVADLRAQLAREWPVQSALLQSEGWPAPPALVSALEAGLPDPPPLTAEALDRTVAQFAHGPRPYESCASALATWASARAPTDDPDDRVLRLRISSLGSWEDVAARAALPSVPAAMRAVKRAVRALCVGEGS